MIAHSKDAVPDVVIAALEYFIAPYMSVDSIITSSGKLKLTLSALVTMIFRLLILLFNDKAEL